MDKFTTMTGVAAPLEIDNVDTDMIIPKQYLKTIKRTGLGAGYQTGRPGVVRIRRSQCSSVQQAGP